MTEGGGHATSARRYYIKFLQILLLISLFFPQQVYAHEKRSHGLSELAYYKIANPTLQPGNTLQNQTWLPNPDRPKKIVPKTNPAARYASGYGRWGCVRFAKAVLGIYGTWGDGGRKLSLNSDGQINDVVIFQIIHVGVITARLGDMITIREWITVKKADGTYVAYERARTLSIYSPQIRGFHNFN